MKEKLEIIFYITAIIGALVAFGRWWYKFLQKKAIKEKRLSSIGKIENDLSILYTKASFGRFYNEHPVLYVWCFIWVFHIGYLGWRKIICYFKQENDA